MEKLTILFVSPVVSPYSDKIGIKIRIFYLHTYANRFRILVTWFRNQVRAVLELKGDGVHLRFLRIFHRTPSNSPDPVIRYR